MPIPAPSTATTLTRELALDSSEIEQGVRTIPAVLSTEYPVDRDGYREVLVHQARAIDLSRAPLPLLEQHGAERLNIGVVRDLRIVDGELRGNVVIGSSPRANELWPDIRDRVITSLSIGYRIHEYVIVGEVLKATRWQPFEVSLVSVPADPGAGLYRSINMPQENPNPPTGAEEIIAAERARVSAINALATQYRSSVPEMDRIATAALSGNTTIDAFRAQVLEALKRSDEAAGGHFNRGFEGYFIQDVRANASDFADAASDALLMRSGIRLAKPHAAARDFRSLSVMDLARICVERSGRSFRGESQEALLRHALSAGDFPGLLGDSLSKAMRYGQEMEAASHRAWCAVTEASDFRALSRVILGSAPDLKQVAELGEYTNGPLVEDKTTLVPKKFGRVVSISWESLLADNLGAFVGMGRSFGQAAMRVEADEVYSALISDSLAGPELADGEALFAVSRKNSVIVNTGTGKPLTAAALGAARAKLRRQTNTGGGLLNLSARILIVPPERESEAEVLVAASSIHTQSAGVDAATPAWISSLIVVAEPRLTNTDTFYLVADSSVIGTGEIAIIGGEPTIEEIEEKRSDKISWKVRHAFAAGFTDFRGIVKGTLTAA